MDPFDDASPQYISRNAASRTANETTQQLQQGPLCCCGSSCDAHGERNDLLKGLEKNLRDACRVGQNLLLRHESYISDAEAERTRMNNHVVNLQATNEALEASNAHLLEENKILVEQVEQLTRTVEDADENVQSLNITLQKTQLELEIVTRLTKRTELLEAQLLECEREQAHLQATLNKTIEEERAANQRWRISQRKIAELQEQMDIIEKEARDERVAHEKTIERLERRRIVERELEDKETFKQGDARERKDNEVVSSFVKEILQDNANMQLAMMELQDLLAFYREGGCRESPELQALESKRHVSLGDELDDMTEKQKRELHVHHHYHAPRLEKAIRPQSVNIRPRKKRPILTSDRFSGRSTPVNFPPNFTRPSFKHKAASSTSSSNFSLVRGHTSNKPSIQSILSQSSVTSSRPGSPRASSYCPSTIFERPFSDNGTEYSRPTSPEDSDIWSPTDKAIPISHVYDDTPFEAFSLPEPSSPAMLHSSCTTIVPYLEDISLLEDPDTTAAPTQTRTPDTSPPRTSRSPLRRNLRRADSHTSLFSISGMDIHTSLPPAPPPPKFSLAIRQHSGTVLTETTASATSRIDDVNSHSQALRGRLASTMSGQSSNVDTFGSIKGWLPWGKGTQQARTTSNPMPKAKSSLTRLLPRSVSIAEEVTPALAGVSESLSKTTKFALTPQHDKLVSHTITSGLASNTNSNTETSSIPATSSAMLSTREERPTPKMTQELLPKPKAKPILRPPGVNQFGGLPPLPRPRTVYMRGTLDEEALLEALDE